MKNKKGVALFLSKPLLWLVFILIIVVFLIFFTAGGMGSSESDNSVVSEEMPVFISTIEAMNYLKTPIEQATAYDILLRVLKQYNPEKEDETGYDTLRKKTAGLLRIRKVKLENEVYTVIPDMGKPGEYKTIKDIELYSALETDIPIVMLDVNKPGEYKKIKEVELYVPSNLNGHDYLKLILNIPHKEKNE